MYVVIFRMNRPGSPDSLGDFERSVVCGASREWVLGLFLRKLTYYKRIVLSPSHRGRTNGPPRSWGDGGDQPPQNGLSGRLGPSRRFLGDPTLRGGASFFRTLSGICVAVRNNRRD